MEAISVDQPGQQPLDDFSAFVQRESWTSQQLQDYQARALSACRAYAYAHSPFYQRFHRGLMDRPLQDLPVLTKTMMMEQFDDLVTDRAVRLSEAQQYLAQADASKLFLDRYRVMATSGSSGQPGVFLLDRAEGAMVAASFARSEYWGGVTLESRAAVVASATPGQLTSQFPVIANGQPVSRIQLSAIDSPATLVRCLNEWQPDMLLGFASIVSLLANEQRQGRLHITPRGVFCGGETLTSDMRRRIEEVWQTELFNIYGTVESGALATDCELHQGLHLFEDFSIVEVVDENNRPVPPGESGAKVLLTVLYRRTQPLIRYEVSDVVRLSTRERCACGRPFALLEPIEGRKAEGLYFPSLRGGEEEVHPFLFEILLDEMPVSGYQVVQEPDALHIFLTGASEGLYDEHVLDVLRQELTKREVIVPAMEIHRVTSLSRNANGKTPRLISHVPRRAS